MKLRERDVSETIAQQVITIMAEQALMDAADVTPDKSLEDLGIDSLGLVESIFAIEEAFDITVPFNSNNPSESEFDISSVASITRAVEALVEDQKD